MPELSRFYGIVIKMYFGDHDPPHFHAEYAEDRAVINIERSPSSVDGFRRALWAWWPNGRRYAKTNSGRLDRRRKNSNRRARSIHCPEPFRCHKLRTMRAAKIHAVEMARKIRDRHVRRLAGKTTEKIIAFYRAAGQAAVEDAQRRSRPRRRRAS